MKRFVFYDEYGLTLLGASSLVIGIVVLSMYICFLGCIKECSVYSEVTGKQTQFRFMNCFVKTEAGWQQWSEYKARALASEGLKK